MLWFGTSSFVFFLLFFHGDDDNKNLLIFVAYVGIPQDIFLEGSDEDKYKAATNFYL